MKKIFENFGFKGCVRRILAVLSVSVMFLGIQAGAYAVNINNEADLDAAIGSAPYGETIIFDNDITLTGALNPFISSGVNLDGTTPSGGNFTLQGNGTFRLLNFGTNSSGNITNLTFKNGYTALSGGAIYTGNNFTGDITNSNFSNNATVNNGGAIYVVGNLAGDISNSNFSNNTADDVGGAIYAGTLSGAISNSIFSNNTAIYGGGAIYTGNNFTGDITNSTFSGNSAHNNGGAINVFNLTGDISDSTFSGNMANNNGGAIWAETLSGAISNSIFSNNTAGTNGGAIYVNNNLSGAISNSTFSGNTVTNNGNGGAIFVRNDLTRDISYSNFLNNTATSGYGGAIYVERDLIGDISYSNFSDNKATYGGAINVERDLIGDISYSNFSNNTATHYGGGAIWARSLTGAILDSTFLNNTATNGGGAIYVGNNLSGDITNSTFSDNKATYGGAIYTGNNFTGDISSSTFSNNMAANQGGAIYVFGDLTGGITNSTFSNNTADLGGAIFAYGDFSGDILNSTFSNNKANYSSGAIYADIFSGDITSSTFSGNAAGGYGGAIAVHDFSGKIINSAFLNNMASDSGGAIYADIFSGTIEDTDFINNTAKNSGGAIFTEDDLTIKAVNKNVVFSGNRANSGNDIYLGTPGKNLNLDAASGQTISFNSGLDLNSGNLNIDGAGSVFINSLLANTALIDIASGATLKLGSNFNLNSATSLTTAGILDTQNKKTDTVNVNNLTSTGGKWQLDVDFKGNTSDKLNVGGTPTGTLTIDNITPLNTPTGTSQIIINDVSNELILAFDITKNIYTDSFKFMGLGNGRQLIFDYVSDVLNAVLAETNPTTLNLSTDITVTGNLNLVASAVTINGNGSSIIADGTNAPDGGISGFEIRTGKTLNLNDITLQGFKNAITNAGGTVNLFNTSILNSTNYAINSDTNITIAANGGNSLFSGNANGIRLSGSASTLTLDAQNGGNITIEDTISSNISPLRIMLTGNEAGSVNLNTNILGADVRLNGTTLNYTDYLNDMFLAAISGAINMTNVSGIQTLNFGALNLNGTINMAVKADLAAGKMDEISATSFNPGGGSINVNKIILLSDATSDSTTLQFADNKLKSYVTTSVNKTAYSPIYEYGVSYDNTTGAFTFDRSANGYDGFNPAIMASSVAATAGTMATQMNTFREAFNNMDRRMLMSRSARLAMKNQNRIALSEGTTNAPFSLYTSKDEGSTWYRPHISIEKVNLKGIKGSSVNNTTYGAYFGGDTSMKELKNGWDVVHSAYGGYTGTHQTFKGIGNYQNGATLGASSTFYKKDFFAGLTANVGYMNNQASTMFGNDNFNTINSGIAAKFGNNFEYKRLIMQPSMLLGYTFIKTFDYTTASGVRVESDPLHAIVLQPGVKLIANTESGWQPYLGANMVWNIMGQSKVRANDIYLPELSIKPYVQYGVGVQKGWNDRFSCFVQAMVRNGGRTGIDFSAGLNIAVGKDPKKKDNL